MTPEEQAALSAAILTEMINKALKPLRMHLWAQTNLNGWRRKTR